MRLKNNLFVVKPKGTRTNREIAIDKAAITCDSLHFNSEAIAATANNTKNCMLVRLERFTRICPIAEKNAVRLAFSEG
jgi:hypothetical protein